MKVPRKPARAWLDEAKLPRLFYRTGAPMELETVRSLLSLQSKEKGPSLDPKVRELVTDLDPARSGDFALALFNLFVAQKESTKDKFCLVLCAVLGDDRVIALLKRKILEWPEQRRGKLSEFAIAALGLASRDSALFTLDSVARRLRTQRRLQAHAALEQLLEAARIRGLAREALIDDILPWHGFEGRERKVGQSGKRFTVGVGLDFKMRYVDEKGAVKKTLSRTVPEEEREEISRLSKSLRDLVKSHTVRLLDCMIAQHGWPLSTWRRLFLQHPILFPFAVRCIWTTPDLTFRALEDGTLTGVEDEEVTPAEGATVRLLHPAVADPELVQRWSVHLVDYEVEQPFAQLDRPRIVVSPEESEIRVAQGFEGRPWDQYERGRFVRRAGWKPLTVYEGKETACFKTYPGDPEDVDVVLMVNQYENVVVGHYFAPYRLDNVESSRFYVPEGEEDPRLYRLGDVPEPIYAEATAELAELLL